MLRGAFAFLLIGLDAAAPCPCADASLCKRVSPAPRAEIFQFQVQPSNWPFYDWSALTTVALFGGTGPDALAGVCHGHSKNVRMVAGAPLSNEPRDLRNETYVSLFIEALMGTVNGSALGVELDGVNFDVEGPLYGADAAALTAAVARTAAALKGAFGAGFQVSVDVAWSPSCIDGRCYDFKGLADASDLLFVMAYDMRSQIKPPAPCVASANSPFPGVQEGLLAFERIGVPPSKLVLGVPWYGYRYPCLPGTAPDAAVCSITHVPFRNVSCSDAAGRELCFSDVRRLCEAPAAARKCPAPPPTPLTNTPPPLPRATHASSARRDFARLHVGRGPRRAHVQPRRKRNHRPVLV
jgi:di-N-acetylchitobiase